LLHIYIYILYKYRRVNNNYERVFFPNSVMANKIVFYSILTFHNENVHNS